MTLTIGSLCTGYGGLDMAVEQVLDARTAWVSDIDKGACKVLAHRLLGVPNIGDMTAVDWAAVEPVDVITGGTPCQDLSHAGKRAGMTEGTRSNLWVSMREAIATIRPRLVVWENVAGAYSAEADSELVNQPRLLADTRRRNGEPVLRALGRVLGDLASLGYVGGWYGLRAADVGAPHGRLRVFVVATPADGQGFEQRESAVARPVRDELGSGARGDSLGSLLPTPVADNSRGLPSEGTDYQSLPNAVVSLLPTPVAREGEKASMQHSARKRIEQGHQPFLTHVIADLERDAGRLLPTPSVADAMGGHLSRSGDRSSELLLPGVAKEITHARSAEAGSGEVLRGLRNPDIPQEVRGEARGSDAVPEPEDLLASLWEHEGRGDQRRTSGQGQEASQGSVRDLRDDDPAARPSQGSGLGERRPGEPANAMRVVSSETALAGGSGAACGCDPSGCPWGQYAAAVHRWEHVLGRLAPPPTEAGAKGNPRLSPRFTEFLMGLPAGWITDVPGITRNEALKLCGNGVVPQQAAAAIRFLLGVIGEQVAA